MARGHGRILTSIWEDADFLTLTQEQQRLYLFLISQPNLNHAGLLPLTLRRWSRKAAGLTPTALDVLLSDLDQARFIVVDDDTEELLIRSFVRNDGVWKQPKVMGAMVSGAMEISSHRLQAALLSEVDRIPLDELSDEPTKLRDRAGPSIRQQVAEHIDNLRRAFKGTPTDPRGGASATPSGTPSGTPSASPSDTPAEGRREASTRADMRAQTRAAPAPAPSPTPAPEKRWAAGDVHPSTALVLVAAEPHAPIDDSGFHLSDELRRWAKRDGYTDLVDIDHATAQFVSHYRSTGQNRRNWPEAWRKWIRDDYKRAVERRERQFGQQQDTTDQFERAMARATERDRQLGAS